MMKALGKIIFFNNYAFGLFLLVLSSFSNIVLAFMY